MRRFDAEKPTSIRASGWRTGAGATGSLDLSGLREIGYVDSAGVLEPEETQSNGTVVTRATNCGEA